MGLALLLLVGFSTWRTIRQADQTCRVLRKHQQLLADAAPQQHPENSSLSEVAERYDKARGVLDHALRGAPPEILRGMAVLAALEGNSSIVLHTARSWEDTKTGQLLVIQFYRQLPTPDRVAFGDFVDWYRNQCSPTYDFGLVSSRPDSPIAP